MTTPLSYSEEPLQEVLNSPMRSPEPPGTYDALFHAICPQRPDMPRPEGPPRVPLAAASQKTTPVRPVYDDFATAHSSITSRSANGLSSNPPKKHSKKQLDFLDPGPAKSGRTQTFESQMGYSQVGWSSTQLPAARLTFCRELSDIDLDTSGVNFSSTRPPQLKLTTDRSPEHTQKLSSPSRFFGGMRKALGSRSSPKLEFTKRNLRLTTKNSSKVNSPQINQQPQENLDDKYSSNQHMLKEDKKRELKSNPLPSSNEMPVYSERQGIDVSLGPVESVWSPGALNCAYHSEKRTKSTASQSTEAFSDILNFASSFPSNIGKDLGFQMTFSAQNGSPVDNVVKSYTYDDSLGNISLVMHDERGKDNAKFSPKTVSRHHIRPKFSNNNVSEMKSNRMKGFQGSSGRKHSKQTTQEMVNNFKWEEPLGQAPNAALPQLPFLAGQRTGRSSSGDTTRSSSYGDVRNLLDTVPPQQLLPTSDDSHIESSFAAITDNMYSGYDFVEYDLASNHSSLPPLDPNPPQLVSTRQTLPLEREFRQDKKDLPIIPQLEHERDVSAALHRMSVFSNPSQDTPVFGSGDGGFQSSTDSVGLLGFISKQELSATEHQILVNQGFYDESAIHQTWLDSHQFERIRIPINRPTSAYFTLSGWNSKSHAIRKSNLSNFGTADEDGRDWETVFESGVPSQPATYPHGGIDRVKRAGSSLANNSDDGINNPVLYQHSDFSSTDRIIQHPAHPEFSHDYRYRETKEGISPILLPSYKPSTVNSFPMNSCRSISTPQNNLYNVEYQVPISLSQSHTNPFTSSPPELLKVCSSRNNSEELSNWVNELGDHRSLTEPGKFSYDLSDAAASGRSLIEAHCRTMTVGSSIADASTASSDISDEQRPRNTRDKYITVFAMSSRAQANPSRPTPHGQPALPRGMPRTFNEAGGSHRKARQGNPSVGGRAAAKRSKRVSNQPYPTNQIRPLSLVEAQRAQPRAVTSELARGNTGQGGFLYRSPLAPIISQSWHHLYTRDQLRNIGNAAKADGVYDLESLSQQPSHLACNDAVTTNGAWKRLSWHPQMFAWPRENSSIQSDLTSRKKHLSNLIFGFCCLFPPFLILYGSGYMDGMMLWITNGDITSFGKLQKKVALQLGCLFVVVLVISVAIIVVTKSTAS